jgi:predicted NAD-dependent protein-ADP-ribosyltransferase YbiA (DUF1768 family)
MTIKFFDKDSKYFEFSNYFYSPFTLDGVNWHCVEHYYQAQKFNTSDTVDYYNLIVQADSPQKTKDMANQRVNSRGTTWYINKEKKELGLMNDAIKKFKHYKIRNDWEKIKDDIMEKGLRAKFEQNSDLQKLLDSTKGNDIIENSPYDYYWGSGSDGTGKNMLGKLLCKIRN